MKTLFSSPRRLSAFHHYAAFKKATPAATTYGRFFLSKKLIALALLFLVSWSSYAQVQFPCNTFIKELYQVGNIEPRVFKAPNASDYYVTTFDNKATYITKIDAAGNLLATRQLNFNGDAGAITDMIVDNFDGTLAGIVRGSNYNIMFKYDFNTSAFSWLKQYPSNHVFQNIHQTSMNIYVVTGTILHGQTTIFDVNRNTGMMATFQNGSLSGEFLSTWDGNNIYGACRYYFTTNSLFLPSLFKFNAAGNNIWRKTYVINPVTATAPARIYPVAPIVDGADLLQLSSGNDVGFNIYPTGPTTKAWLLKTDLNGTLAWTRQINIPGYGQLNAKKIINTATGYYLLIDSYNGSSADYFFVVKTDKNGVVEWANRYGSGGTNSVIAGVENSGFLYLTAVSGSNVLLLKLDAQGKTDANCGYIQPAAANATPYADTQEARPTPTNPTTYSNSDLGANVANVTATDRIACCDRARCTTHDPSFSLFINTASASYFTAALTANDPFGYNNPGFYYSLIVEELDGSQNPYYQNFGTNCWWNYPNQETFQGYVSTGTGTFTQTPWLTCPAPAGRFLYNHTYRITRGIWNDECPYTQFSVIVSTARKSGNGQKIEVKEDRNAPDYSVLSLKKAKSGIKAEKSRIESENEASIYPNPGTGLYTLNLTYKVNASIEIYNALGEKTKTVQQTGAKTIINLTGFPRGIYFVKILSNGKQITRKISLE
jgi:hypothetical protein